MKNICTIIGTVIAKPEKLEEVKEILSAQVAPTRMEESCLNYDFHVDSTSPCVFVFYENWKSQEALDKHMNKPHLIPLLSRMDELLASPIEMRHLTMLSDRIK